MDARLVARLVVLFSVAACGRQLANNDGQQLSMMEVSPVVSTLHPLEVYILALAHVAYVVLVSYNFTNKPKLYIQIRGVQGG